MSEMAKTARKAMKAKASRMTTDPHQKVDSSTWTPPEPLNTEAKTGMQPLVKRTYKRGGKVLKAEGHESHKHAGRKPRKSGGKAMPWVDVLMNRNEKKANTYREDGDKHVGGYKKGGRTKHATSGAVPTPPDMPDDIRAMRNRSHALPGDDITTSTGARKEDRCSGGRTQKNIGGPMMGRKAKVAAMLGARNAAAAKGMGAMPRAGATPMAPPMIRPMKKGGRAHKMDGGPMMPASATVAPDNRNNIVPQNVMSFNPAKSSVIGLKKGGKAEHPDVAEDKALIRKMVKPSARTGKKKGGEVFSGDNYPHKVPGVVPGGRMARKHGGKTGKTHIVINMGHPDMGGAPVAPPTGAMPPRPPMPAPAPQPAAPPPAASPMGGAPAGGPPAGGAPAGLPPQLAALMGRKRGGRTTHIIDHAAGGGLGRKEKIKAYGHKA